MNKYHFLKKYYDSLKFNIKIWKDQIIYQTSQYKNLCNRFLLYSICAFSN